MGQARIYTHKRGCLKTNLYTQRLITKSGTNPAGKIQSVLSDNSIRSTQSSFHTRVRRYRPYRARSSRGRRRSEKNSSDPAAAPDRNRPRRRFRKAPVRSAGGSVPPETIVGPERKSPAFCGRRGVRMKGERVPTVDPYVGPVPDEHTARRQLPNPRIERPVADGIPEQGVKLQRLPVQRFPVSGAFGDLTKVAAVQQQAVIGFKVIISLFAEGIPGAKELSLFVQNDKGKGAVQMARELFSPAPVSGGQDGKLCLPRIIAPGKAELAAEREAVAQAPLVHKNIHRGISLSGILCTLT